MYLFGDMPIYIALDSADADRLAGLVIELSAVELGHAEIIPYVL